MFKGLSLLLSFFYLKDPSIVNALHPNPNAKVKTMEQKSKKTKKREKNAKQKKTKAINSPSSLLYTHYYHPCYIRAFTTDTSEEEDEEEEERKK